MAVEASGTAINLTAVIVASIGAIGAVLSFVQANSVRREQKKMEQRKVDAEAYERARKFDQEVVTGLRAEVERLEGRLQDEMERLRVEQDKSAELEAQLEELGGLQDEIVSLRQDLDQERVVSDELRAKVRSLEERIARLRARLAELGIDSEGDDDGVAY